MNLYFPLSQGTGKLTQRMTLLQPPVLKIVDLLRKCGPTATSATTWGRRSSASYASVDSLNSRSSTLTAT